MVHEMSANGVTVEARKKRWTYKRLNVTIVYDYTCIIVVCNRLKRKDPSDRLLH